MTLFVNFKKQSPDVQTPSYGRDGDSGMDARAYLEEDVTIEPGFIKVIPTGLSFEMPIGVELQARSRSGLSTKGIVVANSPGTIDSSFRGNVGIILWNNGQTAFTVKNGDRIAQLVFAPVLRANLTEKDSLSETDRGDKGFGSSGV